MTSKTHDDPRHGAVRRGQFVKVVMAGAFAALLVALPGQPGAAAEPTAVNDFLLSRTIVDREPAEVTESFSASDDEAFAFARVNNPGAPTSVSFVWHRDNHHHATIHMNVGTSSAWRTWSSVKLQPGLWSVQLVSENGQVLGQKSFRIIDNGTAISQVPAAGGQSKPKDSSVISEYGSN